MRIGRIEIPEIRFPEGIDDQLGAYMEETNDSLNYIAQCGVDTPESIHADPGMVRLYAAVQFLKEDPENGLAALNVAGSLESLGRLDDAVAVLASLHAAGSPGCYALSSEDPAFLAGWMLADANRRVEAEGFYRLSLDRKELEKGPVWAHLGMLCHELARFTEAAECYGKALDEFNKPPEIRGPQLPEKERRQLEVWHKRKAKEQIAAIEIVLKEAAGSLPPTNRVGRDAFGLVLKS